MTTKEAIYLLRNTAWLAPSLEPIDEAIDMACEALAKMEQVDKDINVRSKDEPQTCDNCRFDSRYGIESICTECSRHYSDCYAPKPNCNECETYWNCQGQCDEIPQIEDEWQIEKRR